MEDRDKCGQIAAALLLAADGDLGAGELAALEAHLAVCDACRAQRDLFVQTDRQLMECTEAIDSASASRARGLGAGQGTRPPDRWRWLPAAAAYATIAALGLWVAVTPRPAKIPPFSPAELSGGSTETIRMELPLTPGGNPFLDDSQSAVLADVVIGADGRPRAIHLAGEPTE